LVEGDNLEDLASKSRSLVETLRHQVEQETGSRPRVEMGSPQERLSDIQHSFTEALIKVNGSPSQAPISIPGGSASQVERLKLDQLALEHYLKTGLIRDFDEFFDQHLYSASEAAIRSPLVKHYYFMDIVLTVAQFVKELDGDVNQLDSQVQDLEDVVARVSTPQQIREETRKIFTAALVYRNSGVNHERSRMIHQAQSFIEENLADADISLHTVAATVNLSPSHFSVVFSQEVGENFRDYLTNARIKRAKELLRTTNLKCYQVAFQCGYNDPHYFSYVFKKNTGLSPQQFRDQSK
jgi:two-component system response regulator YesN